MKPQNKKFTFGLLKKIAPRGRAAIIDPLPELLNKWLPKYGINNPKRIGLFLANILTETGGFRALEENMNYSAKRIRQVWPSRFKSINAVKPYAYNPEALANKVYNRYGNIGHPGWGWRYRGRGFMQTTFVDNYRKVKVVTGIDVVSNPNLLTEVEMALRAACIFWKHGGCNKLADQGKIKQCRKVINGGTHGLPTVINYYKKVLPLVADLELAKETQKVSGGIIVSTVGIGVAVPTYGPLIALIVAVAGIIGYTIYKKYRRKKNVEQGLQDAERLEDVSS